MTLLSMLTLIFFLIASISDIFIPFIISTKYPNYSHLKLTISELGSHVSPVKKKESINLIFVGFMFIMGGILQELLFLSINVLSIFKNLYVIGIIIFGLGCIIAGKYPEDPKGEEESKDGKIHGIGSGIGFLFLLMNPFYAFFIEEFVFFLNVILFILGILTFSLFIVSEKKNGNGILGLTGLWQRLNLIVLYSCLIINLLLLVVE